jgi:hypothetical protein
LSAADPRELEAVAANRNSPQKHVWRAKIVLSDGGGLGEDVIPATGKTKTEIAALLGISVSTSTISLRSGSLSRPP